jgi:hypothetical protein
MLSNPFNLFTHHELLQHSHQIDTAGDCLRGNLRNSCGVRPCDGLRSLVNQHNIRMTWIVFFHEHPPVTVWARSFMDARREALRQSGLKDRDIRGCNMRADS